ncbi:hypothetical protein FOCC_FOCC004432 [Frankliniella occidentalis]|nr:hypothetical protein FOCC_FOCC004432 [Frankliniella occidentalis]
MEYLKAEAAARLFSFDETQWKRRDMKGVPQQVNNVTDCGVFTCCYSYFATTPPASGRGAYLEWKRSAHYVDPFTQTDIPAIRQQMKDDIVSVRFIPPLSSPSTASIIIPPLLPPIVKNQRKRKEPTAKRSQSPTRKKTRIQCPSAVKIPRFTKKVDENKATTTDGVYLVTSAHVHLRSANFKNANNCQGLYVYSSLIASRSIQQEKASFSTEQLDVLMFAGYQQFQEAGMLSNVFPSQVLVSGQLVSLKSCVILSGQYCATGRVKAMAEFLDGISPEESQNCSFVLQGHGRSVCFWQTEGGRYFVFNAHCVDINNVVSAKSGAARLYRCMSSLAVGNLVFKNDVHDLSTYELYKVYCV